MALSVKTYPDLSIASLQRDQQGKRHDRELAVWYLLRFLDPDGNAKVRRDDLLEFIRDNSIMSEDNAMRRLRRGNGIFWELVKLPKGVQIRYRSLEHIATFLNVLPRRLPVAIPIHAFGSIGTLRAYFYAAWLNQGCNPISRETIERATDLPKQTQIRYEKLATVRKEKNMGIKPYERGDQVSPGGFVSRDGKWLNLPMPNTYLPLLEQLPRGQLRKVRRHLRGVLKGTPTDSILRRYYKTGEHAAKSKRRAATFFVETGHLWRGSHLWNCYQF